jgi:hypothetical protein
LDLPNAQTFQRWAKTRLYHGVPGGNHTFMLQCLTTTAIPESLTVCASTTGCSWGFVEL